MPPKTGRFERADRLLKPRDFQSITRSGRRIASHQFVILMAVTGEVPAGKRTRLGMTVSRRVGKAVMRNRIKRAVREWFRHGREELASGTQLVVIARPAARDASAGEIARILDEMVSSGQGIRR